MISVARNSHLTPLRQARHRSSRNHEVIEDGDIDEPQRFLEMLGQLNVGGTRVHCPAGMVVRKDRGSGIQREAPLHDLSRVDGRVRERPPEHLFRRNELVLAIEEDRHETLELLACEQHPQIFRDDHRTGEQIGRAHV